jgi:hypothetical protein
MVQAQSRVRIFGLGLEDAIGDAHSAKPKFFADGHDVSSTSVM